MEKIPVDWENLKTIDPDTIIGGEATVDGMSLEFKDGTTVRIVDTVTAMQPGASFHRFTVDESHFQNDMDINIGTHYGDDTYHWMTLTIHIGKYRHYQHSFVDGAPELDANRICAFYKYTSEETAHVIEID